MALPGKFRTFLNSHFFFQMPSKIRLGDFLYVLQRGLQAGQTDPLTGEQVASWMGFDQGVLSGGATRVIAADTIDGSNLKVGTATATVATASTNTATDAVAWPQAPKLWSVTAPANTEASVTSMTYAGGDVTFEVSCSGTGTVTVTFI